MIDRLTVTKTDVSRMNVAERELGLWCMASLVVQYDGVCVMQSRFFLDEELVVGGGEFKMELRMGKNGF